MSVADKLDAARSSLGGSAINKAIYKATSREVMGPKKKHIDCKLFKFMIFETLFHSELEEI